MNILNKVSANMINALDYIVEKNRLRANQNRVKAVIENEEKKINKAYIKLGKYYFSVMDGKPNPELEKACEQIEKSTARKEKAQEILNKLNKSVEEEPEIEIELYVTEENKNK